MPQFLLFQIHGPLASWGDIAVGEERPGFGHPSKSAVMGLLAGALGIRRNEEDRHRTLSLGYGLAVGVEARGLVLSDYHTTQVPPGTKGRLFETRQEELKESNALNTILSRRQYRADVLYTVCLWSRGGNPPHPLPDLAAALKRPVFVPYLGRKSCPPALPFLPLVLEAATVEEAMANASFPSADLLEGLPRLEKAELYWEAGAPVGCDALQSFIRRDEVLSRARWQFEEREELAGPWPGVGY